MSSSIQPQFRSDRAAQPTTQQQPPFPQRFFNAVTGYALSGALKGAIELDLFTAICAGTRTPEALALRLQASVRGVRILCDFLTVHGFLEKHGDEYSLPPDAAMFLDRASGSYIGGAVHFLANDMVMDNYRDVAASVRKGGTFKEHGVLEPEHPVWVEFARAMAPIAALDAELIARHLKMDPSRPAKVLDIAAGHGMYGITLARHNPLAEIVAVDWQNVLSVAGENAQKAGVSGRYHTMAGSAFEVDFGEGYDIVLLTNLLHHFDSETNEVLLRKIHRALKSDGRVVLAEFVPNEDRITPPTAAAFSMIMLASTPQGDAYTFSEFERMLLNAGFLSAELHQLAPSFQQVVIGNK